MPIPSGDTGNWITLSEAKAELNFTTNTNDAELQDTIDAACAMLENLPGYRVVDVVKTNTYREWIDPCRSSVVVLRHCPVTTVTSLTEYLPTAQVLAEEALDVATTFTGYGYTIQKETGIITRTSGGWPVPFRARLGVVYTTGATVPADLREAALKLIKHLWRDQRGTGAGRAIPGESPDEAYLNDAAGAHLLPLDVEQALAPYRRAPGVA